MSGLQGRRIVLGVGGGIAAYKAAELTRLLVTAGAEVHPILTRSGARFITPLTLQTLAQRSVATDLFDLGHGLDQEGQIGHIRLADLADLIVVAPATANLIARFAAGLANDVLTTVVLASRARVLCAPAMNVNMWENPLTQANVRRLAEIALHGYGERFAFVGPGSGFLACGWTGAGRMADPPDIYEAVARLLSPGDLARARVLVTAGPTEEPIDPIRFLGNRSSGKMGYAVARAAAERGAEVTLVSGPTALAAPRGARVVPVRTAREMEAAVLVEAGGSDVVVMAAAVADFRPAEEAHRKLKKDELGDAPQLRLARNPDILAALGARRSGGRPVLIGFAAETGDPVQSARRKLTTKRCDLVVANDVAEAGSGFGADTNRVALVDAAGAEWLPAMTKEAVAQRILDRVAALLGGDVPVPPRPATPDEPSPTARRSRDEQFP